MQNLNFHHLRYFWAAAHEGGITRASERLHTTQPTVSAQIRALEDALGAKLFTRAGHKLFLTDAGRIAQRYADDIFRLGQEMVDTLHDRPTGAAMRLTVGVSDAIPKGIAYRLLAPALSLPERVRLECVEDRTERLLGELASHALDLVIADSPIGPGASVRAHNHLLGECAVSVFGSPRLAAEHGKGFPRSLDGAPFLLPTVQCALRRTLDAWLAEADIHPVVIGEFDDSSLLTRFAQTGAGLFAAPAAIGPEIRRQYGVRRLGSLSGARQQFYAISMERQVRHPGVLAITTDARRRLTG